MILYSLRDQNDHPVHQTALCERHFCEWHKVQAREGAKQANRLNAEHQGHALNEVKNFEDFRVVEGLPNIECIVCGVTQCGKHRPPDTDYEPYDSHPALYL